MAALTEDDARALTPFVESQCRKVAARYDGVNAEDLQQEVWVKLIEGALPLTSEYVARDELGRLSKAVYNIAVTWCEKDKRRKMREAGIDWRDDYNYSRPEVARLLPLALDAGNIPGLSGDGLHDGPSAKSDPAYGGGLLASLIDVRSAYDKLSESDQAFILTVIGLDTNWDDVAATTGIKASSAYAKYMRILDRMVTRFLGRKTDEEDEVESP